MQTQKIDVALGASRTQEPFDIAVGASRAQKRFDAQKITWEELVNKLKEPHRTRETCAQYDAMSKERRAEIKNGKCLVGGVLEKGSRKRVLSRSIISLDLDFPDIKVIEEKLQLDFYGVQYILHSTHSDRPNARRLRLYLRISRYITPDEYCAVTRKIAEIFGFKMFDPSTFDPGRLMFLPSCSKDAKYFFKTGGSEPLDPDEILHLYKDWRDASEWPKNADDEVKLFNEAKRKMQDPSQKHGEVGAFVNTYNIHEAIAKFVPVYRRSSVDPNRYTYTKGSTTNGAITYDDKFLYSHHGTDPLRGREMNAFDVVRLHMFGHLDKNSQSDTDVTELRSYKAMCEFVRDDDKAKIWLFNEGHGDTSDDFENLEKTDPGGNNGEPKEKPDERWMSQLTMGKNHKAVSDAKNIEIILMNDPYLKGRIGYDEFKQRIAARKNLPWRSVTKLDNALNDSDIAHIRHYFDKRWGIKSADRINDAIEVIAKKPENCFHPVRDYLKSLIWDRVKRVDKLLIDYFGAEDIPYNRYVMRKTLLGAVKRVFEPGCKFDTMLILKGPQGCGKSTFFRILAKDWYSDSIKDIKSKDAVDSLQGIWITEFSEMAALRRAESDEIKNFITHRVDRFRPAYGRLTKDFPRQGICVATTNEAEFLRDLTGNRRFLPVRIPKNATPKKDVFEDLEKERDQIWAEILASFYEGEETPYLSQEQEKEAAEMRQLFMQEDPRREAIKIFLEKKLPKDWYDMDQNQREIWSGNELNEGSVPRLIVCAQEIWIEVQGHSDLKNFTRRDASEINKILDSFSDWEKENKARRFGWIGVQKGYVRVQKETDVPEQAT